MFKVIIKGPGVSANLADIDRDTALNMIRMAMEAKFIESVAAKVVTAPEVESEPQQEPASAGDGEPP